ncbi:MAG TPA: hypothetical protein PK209_04630 [Saprospiraceae bacterium]|nr:hypothetical protein [Saprospiraceae bacterium]
MFANPLLKSFVLSMILVSCTVVGWELYLRQQGIDLSYDDEESLWADKRDRAISMQEEATVFVGSSRNKYDVDINTWKSLTGENLIQLSCVGSSPLLILQDLANDKQFSGKVVIDVTEPLFFSMSPRNQERPSKNIKWRKDRTPAQAFSFHVNHLLESQFVFLDKDYFSLNALIDKIKLPNRPGVFVFPEFPFGFERVSFDRQNYMSANFVQDTHKHQQVRDVWTFVKKISKDPPVQGPKLDSILNQVKENVSQILSRGGQVIFIRTPSSGIMLESEYKNYPRQEYWEKLLSTTKCQGIHFADYPPIAHFICPEWSHLTPEDALVYTKNLVHILKNEKGWRFKNDSAIIN